MQHLIATYSVSGLIVSIYVGWTAVRNIKLSRRMQQLSKLGENRNDAHVPNSLIRAAT